MNDETKIDVDRTTSSRGAQWTGTGALLALAAQSLFGGGLLNGVFGGGCNAAAQNAQNSAAVYELSKKDSEIALLNAKLETRSEVSEVYSILREHDKEQDAKTAALESRVLAMETASPLREQLVLQKIDCLAKETKHGFETVGASIAALGATVGSITKLVVPKSAICPEVMSRYNSWTAPAESAATA